MTDALGAATLAPPEAFAAPEFDPQGLILDARSNGVSATAEEFDSVEVFDEEYRYELVDGVVVVSPICNEGEANSNDHLGYVLRRYRFEHPSGAVIDDTMPERYVYVSPGTRRRADRVVWTGLGRIPDRDRDHPSIVIEFVSRTRRDRRRDYEQKRDEYRALGVREYWVIDRFQQRMTVFTPTDERSFGADQVYETPLLPGFQLPLASLFAQANRYGN